jgi:chromate transporter
MILAAGWVLLKSLDGGFPAIAIALVSVAVLLSTRINPLLLLLCGALLLFGMSELGASLPAMLQVHMASQT